MHRREIAVKVKIYILKLYAKNIHIYPSTVTRPIRTKAKTEECNEKKYVSNSQLFKIDRLKIN